MDLDIVVFMGRPGSGKGTQAKLLCNHLGANYFGTGAMFRKLSEEDSPLGKLVGNVIDNGLLMPPWFADYITIDTILKTPCEEKLVIDGSNRTLPEAQSFFEQMQWLERPYRVVYLDVREETILERLRTRGTDSGRADDSEGSLHTRIVEYDTKTAAAREFINEKGLLIKIDGNRHMEDVHQNIITAIETL
jgi:adenylate kinase